MGRWHFYGAVAHDEIDYVINFIYDYTSLVSAPSSMVDDVLRNSIEIEKNFYFDQSH